MPRPALASSAVLVPDYPRKIHVVKVSFKGNRTPRRVADEKKPHARKGVGLSAPGSGPLHDSGPQGDQSAMSLAALSARGAATVGLAGWLPLATGGGARFRHPAGEVHSRLAAPRTRVMC